MKDLHKKSEIIDAIEDGRYSNPCGTGKYSCGRCALNINGSCLAVKARKDKRFKALLLDAINEEKAAATFLNLGSAKSFLMALKTKLINQ